MLPAKPDMTPLRIGVTALLLSLAGGAQAQAVVDEVPAFDGTVAGTVTGAAEQPSEAGMWLQKMGDALRHESYEGIFTYMRGYQLDTVQVAHEFREGQEFERLSHLNGAPRELIRAGDDFVCNHANIGHVETDHEFLTGPFTRAFSEKLSSSQSFYQFSVLGSDRIAGRAAVVLGVAPKNNDRYGYRLWLDRQTGLLLQSHLVNGGRILEAFQFSRIEIGNPINPPSLASTLGDDRVQHRLGIHSAPQPSGAKSQRPQIAQQPQPSQPSQTSQTSQTSQQPLAWRVAWLPSGFRAVISPARDRVLYTDGLATFSVFFERPGASKLGELETHMGGTVVITRRIKGSAQQITVVGEVPADTAKRVAESVEPVIY
jgi:sigma-E factor negative regulatory protein RseB